MTSIDYIIIGIYFLTMVVLSLFLGKGQKTQEDYYVGGRKMKWWTIGISTMATQTSAISFISIPAFVAIKSNGGLSWLQYELAVPFAMIVTSAFLIPYFRSLKLVSLYHYLEMRFNSSVRKTISGIFLISRGLATGVGVYAIALVIHIAIDIALWKTILLIGCITIVYDTLGGIKAVIYSDVIQMIILVFGLIFCICFCVLQVDDFTNLLTEFPKQRLDPLNFSIGTGENNTISFWPFFFGGIFLYVSYYGADQSQVQRELAASSADEVKKSLLLNGLLRFPLTALYCFLGIAIWVYFSFTSPEFESIFIHNPDSLVPSFILELPVVIKGILFSSILAAAMSSLDSALNSLSASTMQDFLMKVKSDKKLLTGKIVTVIWGGLITVFAFFVDDIADTVIESINKIGSAFYGPVLAVFIVGVLIKKVRTQAIIPSLLFGVVLNMCMWLFLPTISWMWWNLIGFLTTVSSSILINYLLRNKTVLSSKPKDGFEQYRFTGWQKSYTILIIYFIGILSILFIIKIAGIN